MTEILVLGVGFVLGLAFLLTGVLVTRCPVCGARLWDRGLLYWQCLSCGTEYDWIHGRVSDGNDT